jgi:hypothetical protein
LLVYNLVMIDWKQYDVAHRKCTSRVPISAATLRKTDGIRE